MSHAGSWRAACNTTIHFLWLHFETPSKARGVTDPSVGSGALFGDCALHRSVLTCSMRPRITQLQRRRAASELQPHAESRYRGTDGVHDLRNTPETIHAHAEDDASAAAEPIYLRSSNAGVWNRPRKHERPNTARFRNRSFWTWSSVRHRLRRSTATTTTDLACQEENWRALDDHGR